MNKGGTEGDTDPTRGLAVLDEIARRGMTTSIGGGRDDVGIPARTEAHGGQEIGLKTKGAMAVRDAVTIRMIREIGHVITAHIGQEAVRKNEDVLAGTERMTGGHGTATGT